VAFSKSIWTPRHASTPSAHRVLALSCIRRRAASSITPGFRSRSIWSRSIPHPSASVSAFTVFYSQEFKEHYPASVWGSWSRKRAAAHWVSTIPAPERDNTMPVSRKPTRIGHCGRRANLCEDVMAYVSRDSGSGVRLKRGPVGSLRFTRATSICTIPLTSWTTSTSHGMASNMSLCLAR
jgi:hypothetical protein